METKANPNPTGCLARALPDEPFVVFLARDPDAPATLEFWANHRQQRLVASGALTDADEDQVADILRDAATFMEWRSENDGRWRDAKPTPIEHPSEDATSLAGRVLANPTPLDEDEVIDAVQLAFAEFGPPRIPRERVKVVLQATLAKFMDERRSLAGAVLRLDPQAGQGGR